MGAKVLIAQGAGSVLSSWWLPWRHGPPSWTGQHCCSLLQDTCALYLCQCHVNACANNHRACPHAQAQTCKHVPADMSTVALHAFNVHTTTGQCCSQGREGVDCEQEQAAC
eukprot:scaffold14143_cov19-Tisochrysis_lutea.AAC.1